MLYDTHHCLDTSLLQIVAGIEHTHTHTHSFHMVQQMHTAKISCIWHTAFIQHFTYSHNVLRAPESYVCQLMKS